VEWDEIGSAMVVFAHPDDGEYGSAGTAARLVGDGKKVVYVVVTDGSKGSPDRTLSRATVAELRRKEQCAAAEVLGLADVEFLGFEDGVLQPTLEVRKAIAAAIRRHKPDILIAQSPVRNLNSNLFVQHPDHLAAGEATFAAVYPTARDPLAFPDLLAEGLEPHKVRELWVAGAGDADYFVDITDTIQTKVRALKAHVSQLGERNPEEFLLERSRQVGAPQGMEYAEGFRRIVIG